jgi:hypothetical protein
VTSRPDERDHHLAVIRRAAILDDDEVAVADCSSIIEVAAHAEHSSRACRRDLPAWRSSRLTPRLRRRARRDETEERQIEARVRPCRDQLTDRLRFHDRRMKPSPEVRQVLVHRGQDDRLNRRPISSRLGA